MKENNIVAVFIDAENVSSKFADKIMEEASNYGDVIIKRAFADWSNGAVEPWRTAVSKHSIIAEQQFSAVRGKNSGDIALIIDAMVVLFEKNIAHLCGLRDENIINNWVLFVATLILAIGLKLIIPKHKKKKDESLGFVLLFLYLS